MKLSDDMKRIVTEQRLGFVATVTPDGLPNLSPKGTIMAADDSLLVFADVASPNTVANLAGNPAMEINVVDPVVRKGYRFRGSATVHSGDDDGSTGEGWYSRGLAMLADGGSSLTEDRVRSIIVMEVREAAAVISPAYDVESSEVTIASGWIDRFTRLYRERFGEPGEEVD